MSLNSFSSKTKFYDDKNFPYGFQRSGYFTFIESECLTNCGHLMNQLAQKKVKPEGEEQKHFMQMLEGKVEAVHEAEKAYVKYQQIIAKKNAFVSSVVKINNDSEEASNNDPIDEEEEA